MSKRNWNIGLALGVAILSTAPRALAAKNVHKSGDESAAASSEQPPKSPLVKPEVTASEYSYSCDRPKDNADAQLCETLNDRNVAWVSVWISGIGGGFTFAGLVCVVLSLRDSREAQKKEFRAYLKIVIDPTEPADVTDKAPILIPYKITNYGRTPARRVRTYSNIVVRPIGWNWTDEAAEVEKFQDRRMILHPGEPISSIALADFTLTPEAVEQIRTKLTCVFVQITVEYETIFKQMAKTALCLEFVGQECFSRDRWIAATDGDEAS
jgi:hypothetical protein